MAGRPSKKSLVIKEIEEVKESPIEKEAVDISEIVDKQIEENDGAIVHPHILPSEEIKGMLKEVTPIRRGVVKCDTPTSWLNVRNAPNGDIIGKLDHGSAVDIFEIQKDFAKISATESKWVSLAYIV